MKSRYPPQNPEQSCCMQLHGTNSKVMQCQPLMIQQSTQVDLKDVFSIEQEKQTRKKIKRRQNKKRKKLSKLKVKTQCPTSPYSPFFSLAYIIQNIYAGQISFHDQQPKIEVCLSQMMEGNRFHDFLNEIIRKQVRKIQKNLWDYMQFALQSADEDSEDNEETFYLMMVDKIYEEYLDLKNASSQIQKIINLFVRLISTEDSPSEENHQLDECTFKFLIQTDETLKTLLRTCEQRISIRHYRQVIRLKEIGQIIYTDEYQSQEEEEYDQYFGEYMEESTQVDEEEIIQRLEEGQKRRGRERQVNMYEQVVEGLSRLRIDDKNRMGCNLKDGWLQKMKTRMNDCMVNGE